GHSDRRTSVGQARSQRRQGRGVRHRRVIIDGTTRSVKEVYSSGTWVTHWRLAGLGQSSEELARRAIAQGLMRPDGVVDPFPFREWAIDRRYGPLELGDLVEFLGVGPLGAFDVAIELRGARRQHEEAPPSPLTGLLELGEELRAPVDLDGAQRE